jgi:hypothetical protein
MKIVPGGSKVKWFRVRGTCAMIITWLFYHVLKNCVILSNVYLITVLTEASLNGHDDVSVMQRSNPADCSAPHLTPTCLVLDTM